MGFQREIRLGAKPVRASLEDDRDLKNAEVE